MVELHNTAMAAKKKVVKGKSVCRHRDLFHSKKNGYFAYPIVSRFIQPVTSYPMLRQKLLHLLHIEFKLFNLDNYLIILSWKRQRHNFSPLTLS
jgi:hypothetical protein